jgi:hypothetical protein
VNCKGFGRIRPRRNRGTVPAKIRTEYQPNRTLVRYRCTNLFGIKEEMNITGFWDVKTVRASETSVTRDNFPDPQISYNQ